MKERDRWAGIPAPDLREKVRPLKRGEGEGRNYAHNVTRAGGAATIIVRCCNVVVTVGSESRERGVTISCDHGTSIL